MLFVVSLFYILIMFFFFISEKISGQYPTLWIIAGTGTAGDSNDGGPAVDAQVNTPMAIWVDTNGNIYITESNSAKIRCIDSNGHISTIAGTGSVSTLGIGGIATSTSLDHLHGIFGDQEGNYLYVSSDYFIWRYNFSGQTVSRIAGAIPASYGFSGDGNRSLHAVSHINQGTFVSTTGIVYFADSNNNRIRSINITSNIITTFAGNGSSKFGGDGKHATSAALYNVSGVFGDSNNNIYIADTKNNRVRLVSSSGIMSTVAGTGEASSEGDGGFATSANLDGPVDVKRDMIGNIYIVFGRACRIRKIDTSGIISTVLGNSTCRASPSTPQAISSTTTMDQAYGTFVDTQGTIYFPEFSASYIRKITYSSDPPSIAATPTAKPTIGRSVSPTSPTASPTTLIPTRIPSTSIPSSAPFAMPTHTPVTITPSNAPTAIPTHLPSATAPSNAPIMPTALPTHPPSFNPTVSLSKAPTFIPTLIPTLTPIPSIIPSVFPTVVPSAVPTTLTPSFAPTHLPTVVPSTASTTLTPSFAPTHMPTQFPSFQPSVKPTVLPSIIPTNSPTFVPTTTFVPTFGPSPSPSVVTSFIPTASISNSVTPTQAPGGLPPPTSKSPTLLPSLPPTSLEPSTSPTFEPTYTSSTCPSTVSPSFTPSQVPTCIPTTAVPTWIPTTSPSTVSPSFTPSLAPSVFMTSQPTSNGETFPPTETPSCFPSVCPSVSLSSAPSQTPTCIPTTAVPTWIPTTSPSTVSPSFNPSLAPSVFMTSQPTSNGETFQPTGSDSVVPTFSPTETPSCVPTICPSVSLSSAPSQTPTCIPTITVPSSIPSFQSLTPTIAPSITPTFAPTITPSITHTLRPSFYPSIALSSFPTSKPSPEPISFPSSQPTAFPSRKPSSKPTSYPTLFHVMSKFLYISRNLNRFKIIIFPFGVLSSGPSSLSVTAYTNQSIGLNYIFYGGHNQPLPAVVLPNTSNARIAVAPLQMLQDTSSRSLSLIGDVNHDGFPDLLLGDPSNSRVFIYSQLRNVENHTYYQRVVIEGESSNSDFGWSVSSAGDMNKDGFDDVVISALVSGIAYVILGSQEVLEESVQSMSNLLDGTSSFQFFGPSLVFAVSNAGDFNDDGFDDIIISLANNLIYLLFGKEQLKNLNLATLTSLEGVTIQAPAYSFAGVSLSGIGDINGDGIDDIAIGSVPYGFGYTTQISYVLYGRRNITVETEIILANITSKNKNLGFIIEGGGFVVSGVGDVNGDGYADIMITSYYDWIGKGKGYIIPYPNLVETSDPSSSPSLSPSVNTHPSSMPSSMPSSSPTSSAPTSFIMVNQSLAPSIIVTGRPSVLTTTKPSYCPSFTPSRRPTPSPTARPSRLPSLQPIDTNKPTMHPSFPPSRRPSNNPTIQRTATPTCIPSIQPSISNSQPLSFVNISKAGNYSIPDGNIQITINTNGNIFLAGTHTGKRIYIIHPETINHTFVRIEDFNIPLDILDLSFFLSITSLQEISYSTEPVTIVLSSYQQVILSSVSNFTLTTENFLFAIATTKNGNQNIASSFTTTFTTTNLFGSVDTEIIVLVVLVVAFMGFTTISGLYCGKRRSYQPKHIFSHIVDSDDQATILPTWVNDDASSPPAGSKSNDLLSKPTPSSTKTKLVDGKKTLKLSPVDIIPNDPKVATKKLRRQSYQSNSDSSNQSQSSSSGHSSSDESQDDSIFTSADQSVSFKSFA